MNKLSPYERISRGPNEVSDKSTEFMRYDQLDLDVKFFLAQVISGKSHLLCIPDVDLCVAGESRVRGPHKVCSSIERNTIFTVQAGIIITNLLTSRPCLLRPKGLERAIAECTLPFAVCNFGIYDDSNLLLGHANGLVFNRRTRTIERYEPHGFVRPHVRDRNIRNAFLETFPNWSFADVHLNVHRGPQMRADAFNGMCETYSVMFVALRLRNPDAQPVDIYNHFERMNAHELLDGVLGYNARIVDSLRSHKRGSLEFRRRQMALKSLERTLRSEPTMFRAAAADLKQSKSVRVRQKSLQTTRDVSLALRQSYELMTPLNTSKALKPLRDVAAFLR